MEASAVPAYLDMLKNACMSASAAASKYLATQNEKDLSTRSNWDIIREYVNDPTSREFNYVEKNSTIFYFL